MTLLGMDTAVVREVSTGLTGQAERLATVTATVQALVAEAERIWLGRDVAVFAEEWAGSHRPALEQVHRAVEELARVALTNADEQDAASGEVAARSESGWIIASGETSASGTAAGFAWKADASYQLGADADADVEAGLGGLGVTAGVWAGLKATAGIEAERGLLSGRARVDGFVGVRADGSAHLGLDGLKGSAEVFAGGKVEGTAQAAVAGVGVKGTAEGWYGVGVEAEGTATFSDGHLVVEGKVGAALGLGGALGGGIDIDVDEVRESFDEAADALGDLFDGDDR